jgi:hypothetical protein
MNQNKFGKSMLAVGLTVFGCLGCQDNESMVFVRGAMKLEAGNCEATADESATLLTNGVVDTVFKTPYRMSLLVGNQLASKGQKTRARTETSNVILEGAEVLVRRPNGTVAIEKFTSPAIGYVPVGSGEGTGYGVMNIVAIPLDKSGVIDEKQYEGGYGIAEIKVFGKTLGGQEVESGVYKFPITVCKGCLIQFPSNLMKDGVCKASLEEETLPCVLGQDDPIKCSVCAYEYSECETP